MIDQYKQLASDIVEYGKKLGADQVSTSLVNAVSFQVEVRDGKIESLKESGSAGMYVTSILRCPCRGAYLAGSGCCCYLNHL